jgi:hypothetical protein
MLLLQLGPAARGLCALVYDGDIMIERRTLAKTNSKGGPVRIAGLVMALFGFCTFGRYHHPKTQATRMPTRCPFCFFSVYFLVSNPAG